MANKNSPYNYVPKPHWDNISNQERWEAIQSILKDIHEQSVLEQQQGHKREVEEVNIDMDIDETSHGPPTKKVRKK